MKTIRHKATETMLVFTAVALLVYLLFNDNALWLYIALGMAFTGIFIPRFAEIVHIAWMFFSRKIGLVVSTVILILIYFFVLVPLAAISRLFGRQIISKSNRQLLWQSGKVNYGPSHFRDLW
ncbi:MAG TPA: SxtJ family membrane protein [Bacteroidales bacterium]|nr:SxtJ family membrane protein [Bacteroidales bacterium]